MAEPVSVAFAHKQRSSTDSNFISVQLAGSVFNIRILNLASYMTRRFVFLTTIRNSWVRKMVKMLVVPSWFWLCS